MQLADPLAEQNGDSGGASAFLVEGVYGFILFITIATWAVIGFLVWIPLLVRTITLLTMAIFYATLVRDQERVRNAEAAVRFAVRFYERGFKHFVDFYRQRHASEQLGGLIEPLSELKWKVLAVECAWVLVFWLLSSYLVHLAFASFFAS